MGNNFYKYLKLRKNKTIIHYYKYLKNSFITPQPPRHMAMVTSSTYNSPMLSLIFFLLLWLLFLFWFSENKIFFVSLKYVCCHLPTNMLALIILKEKMLQLLLFWLPNTKKSLGILYYKSLSSLIRGSVHFQLKKEIRLLPPFQNNYSMGNFIFTIFMVPFSFLSPLKRHFQKYIFH